MNYSDIPQLESDIDKEEDKQFEDIQTYLDHHNSYQESQNIRKEYTKRLLDLDDERYYWDIDHIYLDLRPNSRPHTSHPKPQTTPHDVRAHTNIRQSKEDKPAEKSSMDIDPLEPIHDPYRAEFKEKLRRLNA